MGFDRSPIVSHTFVPKGSSSRDVTSVTRFFRIEMMSQPSRPQNNVVFAEMVTYREIAAGQNEGKQYEMREKSLREQLVGAWVLTSCVERDIETAVENHPLGDRPLGFILYTPDGYMSAQLQRRERLPFADGDLLRATPEEYSAAGSSYIAYSGRFFVDEDKKSLSHEMAVSFFPNWFGQLQVRLVEVNGKTLRLRTDGPQRFNGALKTATLTWRRAQPN
jgi:hypothetical protein